jgi:hypothetical protein
MQLSKMLATVAIRRHITLILFAFTVAMTGCAAEAGDPSSVATGPHEAKVRIGEGLVFSTGELVTGASYLNVDLIVYKNQGGFDIKPGGSSASDQMAMKVFGNGGVEQVFASLDEVPKTLPGNDDMYGYMQNVSTGWGGTVQHNIGDGHSRFWIKAAVASAGIVQLQWETIAN